MVLLTDTRYLILYDWNGERLGEMQWPSCDALAWGSDGELWFAARTDEPSGGFNTWRANWDLVHTSLTRRGTNSAEPCQS